MVNAFEGNKAETTTMRPTLKGFVTAHGLRDVVIAADPGMVSETNTKAIAAQGLSFIVGMRSPEVLSPNGDGSIRTRRFRTGMFLDAIWTRRVIQKCG